MKNSKTNDMQFKVFIMPGNCHCGEVTWKILKAVIEKGNFCKHMNFMWIGGFWCIFQMHFLYAENSMVQS